MKVISIDVRDYAQKIISTEKHPYSVLRTIACRMLEAAVDVINNPEEIDDIIDPLAEIFEESYKVMDPEELMYYQVKRLRELMEGLGWDSRLKIKVQIKSIGDVFCRGLIRMDLDATFIDRERKSKQKPRRKPPTVEAVNENPSLDEINEFINVVNTEHRRRANLRTTRTNRRA